VCSGFRAGLSLSGVLELLPFIESLKDCFGINQDNSEAKALRKLEQGLHQLFGTPADEIAPWRVTFFSSAWQLPTTVPLIEVHPLNCRALDGPGSV
jgi:hypothetical protein